MAERVLNEEKNATCGRCGLDLGPYGTRKQGDFTVHTDHRICIDLLRAEINEKRHIAWQQGYLASGAELCDLLIAHLKKTRSSVAAERAAMTKGLGEPDGKDT